MKPYVSNNAYSNSRVSRLLINTPVSCKNRANSWHSFVNLLPSPVPHTPRVRGALSSAPLLQFSSSRSQAKRSKASFCKMRGRLLMTP